jgi:hypothetical protein
LKNLREIFEQNYRRLDALLEELKRTTPKTHSPKTKKEEKR